jgi:hypothetical protein
MVSEDPFRFRVLLPVTVEVLAVEELLLSDASVSALVLPLSVLAALIGVGLPFSLFVVLDGTGGGFSATFFATAAGFFAAAVLVVEVVDLIEAILGLFLAAAVVRAGFTLSTSGTGAGRFGVVLVVENVDVTEASDVLLDLSPEIADLVAAAGPFVSVTGPFGVEPVVLTLTFDAELVLSNAVLNVVLASLAVEIRLELTPEVGRLVALDGGRNVDGPEGEVFGVVVVSLEGALIFLTVDAWLLTEATLPAEDTGLSAVGVDVREAGRRVTGGVETIELGFDTLGVFLPFAAGVFLPSRVDTDAELGVSLESGLGPGGG